MPIIIKGIHVDAGKPVVCVPITEKKAEDITAATQELIGEGVKMLEWRLDCFENYHDIGEVRDILAELQTMTRETILLVTLRSEAEGGEALVSEEERVRLYDQIAQAHAADIIDVEAFSMPDPTALIKGLHARGALVMLSHHEFQSAPTEAVMDDMLKRMVAMDGDLVKLAVMPHDFSDTLSLMASAWRFHAVVRHTPLVAIAMGQAGRLSRVTGELFGSCITFAAGKDESAPGQLPFDEAGEALDFVHRYFGAAG